MRTMYDAVYARNIPLGARIVAGYLDGRISRWATADWARFPNAVKVAITVIASNGDGMVLDVENGDARPEDAPPWAEVRRGKGCDPCVYCAIGTWPVVRQKFTDAGVELPHFWIANPTGSEHLLPGTMATQWAFGPLFDTSAVVDWWPGVDNGQTIQPVAAAEFLGHPPASVPPGAPGGATGAGMILVDGHALRNATTTLQRLSVALAAMLPKAIATS